MPVYLIESLTKDLIVKGKRKRKYKKVKKNKGAKRIVGTSIEKRPEYILTRDEFGHWEMDTVKGKNTSHSSMLVMTERKTRKEIIVKLKLVIVPKLLYKH